MSGGNRAIVPLGQRGVVASVNRQFAITEKLVGRIQSAQNLLDVFNVPQDGSFEEAIAKILPNGIITMAAGRYILEASVTITKPLRIKGAGRDETIIESSVDGTIICVNTDGLFELEHIGIVRSGEQSGDMLSILAQEVLVKRCSLTGNRNISDKEYHWSGGIRIAGSTSGSVYFTNVTHCGSGIVIEGNAEIKLSFNKCVENAISGISFSESATGIAESSICCRNKEFGISVFDHSKVHLTNNHCEENEFAGISLSESSTGTVNNNTCSRNKWEGLGCGIRADGNSKVDLFGNCCEENEFSGILFSESSTGRAVNNRCNKNKGASILGCGIMIFGQSIVNLVGNCCEENHNSGISYSESASGRVENNTCRLNKKKGITIELEKADMVILKNNVCEDNGC